MTLSYFLIVLLPSVVMASLGYGRYVIIGGLVWAGSVALKALLGALLYRTRTSSRAAVTSAIWGVWSAGCELSGAGILFLVVPVSSVLGALAVGAGASGLEGALEAIQGPGDERLAQDMARSPYRLVTWFGVLDRGLATVGHMASRIVVWVGVSGSELVLVLPVLVTFAAVDARAVYLATTSPARIWLHRRTVSGYLLLHACSALVESLWSVICIFAFWRSCVP